MFPEASEGTRPRGRRPSRGLDHDAMGPDSIDSSPMLRRIGEALRASHPSKPVLWVSVSPTPKWEPSPHGDEVLLRWLCWSVNDGRREVVAPEFEAVSQYVTEERLREELPSIFPDVQVVVDRDIGV